MLGGMDPMRKNSNNVGGKNRTIGMLAIAAFLVLFASTLGVGWISLSAVAGTSDIDWMGDTGPEPTGGWGSGWINDTIFDQVGVNCRNPAIATGAGNSLHATIQCNVVSGGWNIYYTLSTDGGATWGGWDLTAGSLDAETNPDISVHPRQDRIFIAYERLAGAGNNDIYVAYSDDGATWTNVLVFGSGQNQVNPSVLTEHDNTGALYDVWVAFERQIDADNINTMVYRSTDQGGSWSQVLNQGVLDALTYSDPDLAYMECTDFVDRLYVVFKQGVDGFDMTDITYMVSENDGANWLGPVTIRTGADTVSYPTIAASRDGDIVMAAWQVNAADAYIQYAYDHDPATPLTGWGGGTTRWDTDTNGFDDLAPELKTDGEGIFSNTIGGNIYLVWTQAFPENDVVMSQATVSGFGFGGAPIEISDTSASASYPVKGLTTRQGPDDSLWYPAVTFSSIATPYEGRYTTPGMRSIVDTNPSGLDTNVDAALLTAPVFYVWPAGYNHDLWAYSPQAAGPGNQYSWVDWSDAGTQGHAITAGTVDINYTANYVLQYEYVFTTTPINLDVEIDGVPTLTPANVWFDAGTVHDVFAPSPQFTLPGIRYVYNSWSDLGAQFHQVTATAPASLTAAFDRQYFVEVIAFDNTNGVDLNGVEVTVNAAPVGFTPWTGAFAGGDWFQEGVNIDIGTENPYFDGINNFLFVDWSTGSANNPLPHTPTNPITLTAYYVEAPATYFSVSVDPPSVSVSSGNIATYTVTVQSHNGYTGNVGLTANGNPGVENFAPPTVSPPADGSITSTLTIDTAAVADGTYPFTIVGNDGLFTNNTAAELVVATPYFKIDVIPTTRLIAPGEITTYTVNVSSFVGYTGQVDLNVTGVPAPASGSFTPDIVTVPADGYILSTLEITGTAGVLDAVYPLTITGDDYTLPQETQIVTLDVQTVPLFSIGASPILNQVSPGGSADYVITFTSFNGYWGNVSVSVEHSILSTQATFSFVSPVDVPPPSNSTTITITTTASIPDGDYTITVYGEDPLLPANRRNKSIQITLNVSSMVPGTISGKVTDQNGDTVDDADVELQDDQGNTVETTQTDNEGKYAFTGVDPGDYTVIATKTGYKSDQGDVTLGSGGSETRDLQIEQGTIRGKVVDEDGKGVEDADVELRDDNGDLVRETTTDAGGNFRFDDLPLGTYTVIIKASGYDTRTEDGVVVDEDDNVNNLGTLDVTPKAAAGNFLADYWWLLLLIIIIVVVLILVLMLAKRKKPAPEEAPPEYATAQVPAEQAPPYQEAPAEQPPSEAPPEQYPQEPQPEQYPEEPQPETPPEETPPETPPEGYPPEE